MLAREENAASRTSCHSSLATDYRPWIHRYPDPWSSRGFEKDSRSHRNPARLLLHFSPALSAAHCRKPRLAIRLATRAASGHRGPLPPGRKDRSQPRKNSLREAAHLPAVRTGREQEREDSAERAGAAQSADREKYKQRPAATGPYSPSAPPIGCFD